MSVDVNMLALQYALGEMSEAEAAAFENTLERDQSAREALGGAVLLMSAVQSLPKPAAVPSESHRLVGSTRSRWAALISVVAATVAVVALLGLPKGARNEGGADAPTVVAAWSELAPGAGWTSGTGGNELIDSDRDGAAEDANQDVPDWIVAAVLEEANPTPASEGTL